MFYLVTGKIDRYLLQLYATASSCKLIHIDYVLYKICMWKKNLRSEIRIVIYFVATNHFDL